MDSLSQKLSEKVFYWPGNMIFEKDRKAIAIGINKLEIRIEELKKEVEEVQKKNASLKELI